MVKRKCATCGKDFEAQRSTAKYCKPSCRVRASQTKAKLVLVPPPGADLADTTMPPASQPAAPVMTGVLAATAAELEQLAATNTALGQLALKHAAKLEYVADTASGTAALSRELRMVLDAIKASSSSGRGDPVDGIFGRVRQKGQAAGT